MNKIIHSVIEFIEKIILYPFKSMIKKAEDESTKRSDDFLATVKKQFSERTDAENFIFNTYFRINIARDINIADKFRFLGATEASLIFAGYLSFNNTLSGKLENEIYEDFIKRISIQYLTDHNIL